MELGLGQRTALVRGGGGGLGGTIATTLAREGAAVAAADINVDAARVRASTVTGHGGRAFPLQGGLANLSVIPDRVDAIEAGPGAGMVVRVDGGLLGSL